MVSDTLTLFFWPRSSEWQRAMSTQTLDPRPFPLFPRSLVLPFAEGESEGIAEELGMKDKNACN